MEYLKSNLWEIKKSSALRFFGAILAICHILTWMDWSNRGKLPLVYLAQANPMCWSLWEACHTLRVFPLPVMEVLFNVYLGMAILALVLFIVTQLVGLSWFVMILVFTIKLLFYFQDYRLSSNEHYFLLIANFAFLFIPNKVSMLKYLVISFFVASGLLKLYPQWMAGLWFEERLQIPIKLAEWMAAVGYLVETIAPVALLLKDARFFSFGLLALIAYQLFLWYTDSFFVPAVNLVCLTYFIAVALEKRRMESEFIYQSFIRPEPSKLWLSLGMVVFWAIQGLTFLPMTSPNLRRVSENLSMDPMAMANECESKAFLVFEDRTVETELERGSDSTLRCNSYMTFLNTKSLCAKMENEPGFKTVAGYFRTRSLRDSDFHSVYEVEDFCDENLTFKTLGAN